MDDKDRILADDTLMICDGKKARGGGRGDGGLNSEIEATTTRVLIESAYFDPISIRKTAKRLTLNTDASHRFERGVDPEGTTSRSQPGRPTHGGHWRRKPGPRHYRRTPETVICLLDIPQHCQDQHVSWNRAGAERNHQLSHIRGI
ncbi:MAG: phenylalanine--tRNA ligase beta subunit-related protein [Desulfobacterales bacterium]